MSDRLTGTQYVKLVDILHGHPVRRELQSVKALIAAGLVVEVRGELFIADADRYDNAVREYEDRVAKQLPRISSSPAPARPDMSGYPTTAERMAARPQPTV
jgi:hypothetical protein